MVLCGVLHYIVLRCTVLRCTVLEKEGEILFDLKRWGESDLQLDYWKRQASDGCTGFCGIGSMVLDARRTKLLVHAIDLDTLKLSL